MKPIRFILPILLIFGIFALASAKNDVYYDENGLPYAVHILREGETFWRLAKVYYGNGSFATFLAEYNNIPNIRDVPVGKEIKIPHVMTYQVKRGDSLTGISRTILGDIRKYTIIAEYNDISNPRLIAVGQIIRIPLIPSAAKPIKIPRAVSEQPAVVEKPPIAPEKETPVAKPEVTEETRASVEKEIPTPTEEKKIVEEFVPTEAKEKKPEFVKEKEEKLSPVLTPLEEEKQKPTPMEEKEELELPIADDLKRSLIKNGFENVSVVQEDGLVIVAYENGIYRHEISAMRKIMAIILPIVKDGTDISLIPQNRGIPIMTVTMPVDKYRTFLNSETSDDNLDSNIDASFNVDHIWRRMNNTPRANSSFFGLNIVIHPQFKARFGNYDDPVESQINLVPEVSTTFWKGMCILTQLIIPIQNQLEEEGDGDYLRPGLLTVNQTFRIPFGTLCSITTGYFTQHRYGADMEVKKFSSNGTWSIGVNIGYTGYAEYYRDRTWRYLHIDTLSSLCSIGYRFPRFNLSLQTTFGTFLYNDKGWRIDMLRQFGEVDIGFFAIKTEVGTNGGFNFCIPIFPYKYLRAGPIRIYPAKEFPWEYRYKVYIRNGFQYDTGHRIDDFRKRLNPDYAINQISVATTPH